jgi:hypothetical protein
MTGHFCMPWAWGTHVDGRWLFLSSRQLMLTPLFHSMYFFVQKNVVRDHFPILAPDALYLLH